MSVQTLGMYRPAPTVGVRAGAGGDVHLPPAAGSATGAAGRPR